MIHTIGLLIMTMIPQPAPLSITSPAFTNEGAIPEKYTCQGKNISPQLNIANIPQGAQTLVLIMDDPDAPNHTFDHWVLFNIEPVSTINENRSPGTLGKNGADKSAYTGPCPPTGMHRYFFKVYALDSKLQLKEGATKLEVEDAMKGHVLGSAQLMGTYQKRS